MLVSVLGYALSAGAAYAWHVASEAADREHRPAYSDDAVAIVPPEPLQLVTVSVDDHQPAPIADQNAHTAFQLDADRKRIRRRLWVRKAAV